MDYIEFDDGKSIAKDLTKEYAELVGLNLPPDVELLPEFYAIELCRYRISLVEINEFDDVDTRKIAKLDAEQRLRYRKFPANFKKLLNDTIANNSKKNTNSYFF